MLHLPTSPERRQSTCPDLDLKGLCIVALTLAGRTRSVHTRQKEQFYAHEPFPLAGFASALRDIERESARIVPPGARQFRGRKKLTDVIEKTGIGGEV